MLLWITVARVDGVATIRILGLVGHWVVVRVRVAHGSEAHNWISTAIILATGQKRDVIRQCT